MKINGIVNTGTSLLILAFSCFSNSYGQPDPNTKTVVRVPILQKYLKMAVQTEQASESPQDTETLKPRTTVVKMTDFYLREGKLMFGKLVSEDKNKVTIEQLEGSAIVVSTYSKREIDPRTLQTRTIPEYKYYMDLAEYFSGRTWDFKDDPDDFIQAIRCYQMAKQLMAATEAQGNERIEQINERIKQLQADREVWTREAQSRAELKKLEFQAEFEKRFKELEDKVNASSQKVNESVERLDKVITEMQNNHKKLEQNISVMGQDISRQFNVLADRIEASRRMVDPFYFAPRYRYPYGY
jgi:hypothetical protein